MATTTSRFPARATSTLGDEEKVVTGALLVSEESMVFKGGDLQLEMSFEVLELDVKPSKNSPVSFLHPEHSDWCVTAYDQRILKEPPFLKHTHLRRQVKEGRQRDDSISKVIGLMVFAALYVAIPFVVGYAIEQAVPAIAASVPAEFEAEIGESLKAKVLDRHSVAANLPDAAEKLNALARRIVPEHLRDDLAVRVHLIDDPQPNAFSVPGGDIFVFTGVLQRAQDGGQIAGVLAHEIAHIALHHGIRSLIARKGPGLYVQHKLGNQGPILAAIRASQDDLIDRELPVPMMIAADKAAFGYLVEAGINPLGLSRFLYRLTVLEGKAKYEGLKLPLTLRPPSPARRRAYNTLLAGLDSTLKFKEVPMIQGPPLLRPESEDNQNLDM